MRKLIAASAIAAFAFGAAMFALHPGGPRTCTFDGGGTITAGQAARTSDGHVWQCTEDGRLVRIG
jgi:hypothetical protein